MERNKSLFPYICPITAPPSCSWLLDGSNSVITFPHTQEEKSDKERWQHLADLADFALAMKDTLTNINNQSFNNFMLRIGKGAGSAGTLSRPDWWGRHTNRARGAPMTFSPVLFEEQSS